MATTQEPPRSVWVWRKPLSHNSGSLRWAYQVLPTLPPNILKLSLSSPFGLEPLCLVILTLCTWTMTPASNFPPWSQSLHHGQNACVCAHSLSRVQLLATPWTVALQVPLSMGFSQARLLEWVAISFSRGSSRRRDGNCISCIAGRIFFFFFSH